MTKPSPQELWKQANGDSAQYGKLMKEHGYLVEREPTTRDGILAQIKRGHPDVLTPDGQHDYIFMRYAESLGIAQHRDTALWHVVIETALGRLYLLPLALDTKAEANVFLGECVEAYRALAKQRGWDRGR